MEAIQAPLLTVKQAAQQLNIGCTKLRELIDHEGLPVVRFGRSVRVDPVDLRTWLKQRKPARR